ncbi:MAG: hypothetical protein R3E89_13435 [Thiolinea sp.]
MQRDEISERAYWLTRTREVGQLLGEHWERMEILLQRSRGAAPLAVIRPEFLETLAKVRAACRLAILSNELDLFYGNGIFGSTCRSCNILN